MTDSLHERIEREMRKTFKGLPRGAYIDAWAFDNAVSVAVRLVREAASEADNGIEVARANMRVLMGRAEAAERALEAANKDATTLLPADPAHDDCVVVLRSGINYIAAEARAAERALAEERERRGHAFHCRCCSGCLASPGMCRDHHPRIERDPRCAPPAAAEGGSDGR